ncbi:MAG: hypothetical protein U0R19_15700 [Bryobacteraceae bacterium]
MRLRIGCLLWCACALRGQCPDTVIAGTTSFRDFAAFRYQDASGLMGSDAQGRLLVMNSSRQLLRLEDGVLSPVGEMPEGSAITAMTPSADGSLYVATGARVWRLTEDGKLEPVAGTAESGFSGDGGAALNARLGYVTGLGVAADGSLLIGDGGNFRIRRVQGNGIIDTIAGNGGGNADLGNGGPAIEARFGALESMAVLKDGSIYFLEVFGSGRRLRLIRPDGIIETLGAQWKGVTFRQSSRLAVTLDGRLLLHDDNSVRMLADNGELSTVGVSRSGTIDGIAAAGGGKVYLRAARVIWESDGVESQPVVNAPDRFPDGIRATALSMDVAALHWGPDNQLYLLDRTSRFILRMSAEGRLYRYLPVPREYFDYSQVLFDGAGRAYVQADGRILRVNTDGSWAVIAGGTEYADGSPMPPALPARAITWRLSSGLFALGPDDAIYVADAVKQKVWKIENGIAAMVGPAADDIHSSSSLLMRADGSLVITLRSSVAQWDGGETWTALMRSREEQYSWVGELADGTLAVVGRTALTVLRSDGAVHLWPALGSGFSGFLPAIAVSREGMLVQAIQYTVRSFGTLPDCAPPAVPALRFSGPLSAAVGSRLRIDGYNLGPVEEEAGKADATGRLPREISGVSVLLNGEPAPLISVSRFAVRILIPWTIAAAKTELVVVRNGASIAPQTVDIVPRLLRQLDENLDPVVTQFSGIYTITNGTYILKEDGTRLRSGMTLSSGSMVSIYLTGVGRLGPHEPMREAASLEPRTAVTMPLELTSSSAVSVTWSGEVPGQAGVYKLNMVARPGLIDGIVVF